MDPFSLYIALSTEIGSQLTYIEQSLGLRFNLRHTHNFFMISSTEH